MFFLAPRKRELIVKELIIDKPNSAFGNNSNKPKNKAKNKNANKGKSEKGEDADQGGSTSYIHGSARWREGVEAMYRILDEAENRQNDLVRERKLYAAGTTLGLRNWPLVSVYICGTFPSSMRGFSLC
jgi:hypothetical protein